MEALARLAVELGEGIGRHGEEDAVLPQLAELPQMVAPAAVDREEGEAALDGREHRLAHFETERGAALGAALGEDPRLGLAREDRAPPAADREPLPLGDLGVRVERPARAVALVLHDALGCAISARRRALATGSSWRGGRWRAVTSRPTP
ncbi:MAG: hypothetical protein U0599_25110 [Vicinamibacteria bacterium]